MAKNRQYIKGVLHKLCPGCGKYKPINLDHFYRSGLGRYSDRCRVCLGEEDVPVDRRGFFVPIDENTLLPLEGARAGVLSFTEVHRRLGDNRLKPGALLEQGDDRTVIARYRVTETLELERIT